MESRWGQDSVIRDDSSSANSVLKLRRKIRRRSDPVTLLEKAKLDSFGVVLSDVKTATMEMADQCMQGIQIMQKATKDVAELCITTGYELLSHHQLPEWLKDNEFLPNFHRPQLSSVRSCFRSILKVHSETGNIWTHLVGQILFILASINFYFACPNYVPSYIPKPLTYLLFWLPSFWSVPESTQHDVTRPLMDSHWDMNNPYRCILSGIGIVDHIMIGLFFFGAIICLLFSWLFHTLCCHSARATVLLSKLDYSGISFLIITSCFPPFYFFFKGNLRLQLFYNFTVAICGLFCIVVSTIDKFAKPQYRPIRAGLFMSLGLFGVIPMVHAIILRGIAHTMTYAGGYYVVLMAIFYISGALLYANRFPEKFFPHTFNIWFHSHQLFHVCVVIALFCHLKAVFIMVHSHSNPTH